MSLALAALGQRAAMASELAGFGRNFRADMDPMKKKKNAILLLLLDPMVSKNLAFKSWGL